MTESQVGVSFNSYFYDFRSRTQRMTNLFHKTKNAFGYFLLEQHSSVIIFLMIIKQKFKFLHTFSIFPHANLIKANRRQYMFENHSNFVSTYTSSFPFSLPFYFLTISSFILSLRVVSYYFDQRSFSQAQGNTGAFLFAHHAGLENKSRRC